MRTGELNILEEMEGNRHHIASDSHGGCRNRHSNSQLALLHYLLSGVDTPRRLDWLWVVVGIGRNG